MKQIKLLRDHETPEGNFKAGEMIEVTDEQYEWLMAYYRSLRAEQVEVETKALDVLKKAKMFK